MAAAVPAPFLLDAADAAAIAEAATAREASDYGRYYEEYDDDEEVRRPIRTPLRPGSGHCVARGMRAQWSGGPAAGVYRSLQRGGRGASHLT